MPSLKSSLHTVVSKVAYGDLLLSLYVLVTVRQYFWIVPNNHAAWTLSIVLTVSLLLLHCSFKEEITTNEKSSALWFTLIIVVPLFIIYFMRASIPDTTFDQLNYHITSAERALRGFPYIEGDFFPTGLWTFLPSSSMFMGLFRNILGYRAGTLGNLLILIWIAKLIDKFLVGLVHKVWKRYLVVLLIISCEYILMDINSYMVDLLSIPLLLESLWLTLYFEKIRSKQYHVVYISFLLGLSVALKLPNLAFVIPITAALLFRIGRSEMKLAPKTIALSLTAFLLPLVPYSLYIYMQTSNPIFPLYNSIFKSPYWELADVKDLRWGPKNILETICWPLFAFFSPGRVSEMELYSGRVALVFATVLFLLFLQKREKLFLYVWLAAALLWSATSGYIRYVLFLEVLGGIIIARAFFDPALPVSGNWPFLKVLKPVIAGLIVCQVIFAYALAYHVEWSWRQNIFQNRAVHFANMKYFFQDYSLKYYVAANDQKLTDSPDVWLNCCEANIGYATLLNPALPIVNIVNDELFSSSEGKGKFLSTLQQLKEKRMFAVCSEKSKACCEKRLGAKNFVIKNEVPLHVSFLGYSADPVYMLEVLSPPVKTEQPTIAVSNSTVEGKLVLINYGPTDIIAGQVFNKQPNGESALWTETVNATPSTILVFNGTSLESAPHPDGKSVTAEVPRKLYQKSGVYSLYLLDKKTNKKSNDLKVVVKP